MRTHNSLVYRYPGRRRHEDRLHLRRWLQRRRDGDEERTQAHHRRPRVAVRQGAHAQGGGPFRGRASRAAAGSRRPRTLSQLPPSPYATPTDIREVACGKRRNVAADAEERPAKPVTRSLKPESVMATLMQAPAAAPDGPLLTSWTIAPPIPVGPYKGPRRPPQIASLEDAPEETAPQSVDEAFKAVQAAARVPSEPGAVSSYAAPAPGRPLVLPSDPGAASALPDQVPAAPPGAIRPGTASPRRPRRRCPGQIPRAANPLENLASDPLSLARQAALPDERGRSRQSPCPLPVPRPDELRPARPAPRKKIKRASADSRRARLETFQGTLPDHGKSDAWPAGSSCLSRMAHVPRHGAHRVPRLGKDHAAQQAAARPCSSRTRRLSSTSSARSASITCSSSTSTKVSFCCHRAASAAASGASSPTRWKAWPAGATEARSRPFGAL